MIIVLHRDPLIAAKRYKRKHLKIFIRVYEGYLIKALERKYDGQLLLFDDYSDIEDPWLRWLLMNDTHYLYLLFLTHYLVGQYEQRKPDYDISAEVLGIDILLRKSRPMFPKKFSKILKIPDEKGQTLNHYKNEIAKHRNLYNKIVKHN
jgi:hypothetical protein